MKVKVKPYKSVCYRDIWYNQGDVIEVESLDGIADDVEAVEEKQVETNQEEA